MTRYTVLIGTRHEYQLPGRSDSAEFQNLIVNTCLKFEVKAIAEEMSMEGLQREGVAHSVCREIAESMSLRHSYCDPDSIQRERREIFQENDIRARAFLANLTTYEIEALIRATYSRREGFWLERLNDLNTWPVLFICGADHVTHFRDLLIAAGITTDVVASDWAPSTRSEI